MSPPPVSAGFRPPVYPYDRLIPLRRRAAEHPGGAVDLSVGTPIDAPPEAVLDVLADRGDEALDAARGYPSSAGAPGARAAVAAWMAERLGVTVDEDAIALCVGTKEFVASTPRWLALREPGRDTVLYPEVAYPTYEMGAILAGLRPVAVPVDAAFRLDLSRVAESDAKRALLLWVNSPGNPAGQLEDLGAVVRWARERQILVVSDECYAEFTWDGPPSSVLDASAAGGDQAGLLALHSLSKRSNLAGLRFGWYAGDRELVGYLKEVRQHAGLMVPGVAQRAGIAALAAESHARAQRDLYFERLELCQRIFAHLGVKAELPGGGIYLWAEAPEGDAWGLAERLAAEGGAVVAPGDLYGKAGAGYVRLAVVQPTDRLELVGRRMGM